MATQGPTPGPTAQQSQQQQGPTQQQLLLDSTSPPGPTSLSWEGDRMFNIYIYDYCTKRGFHNTARELCGEAEIAPDSAPPINAKQGLLFEWWSVFWVLFTAKSSNTGSEDALMYTQHQAQQAVQRQTAQRMQQAQAQAQAHAQQGQGHPPLPLHSSGQPPLQQPSLQLVQQPGGPPLPQQPGTNALQPGPPAGPPNSQQAPMSRLPNGMPRPGGPGAPGQPANGPNPGFMPNGHASSPNGAPGAPGVGPFPGQGMPNGVGPQQSFNGMAPGQRPTGAQQTAQRALGSNGLLQPFPSPTMAHSPPGGSGQPGPPQGIHGPPVPPMGQLGPSPQGMQMATGRPGTGSGPGSQGPMASMMHPGGPSHPNGPGQAQGGMGQGPTPSQTPVAGFAQLGGAPGSGAPGARPPSRTTTPGGNLVQQSPSMMNRQIPGAMAAPGMHNMGGMPGMPGGMNPAMQNFINEYNSIPPNVHKQLKAEFGIQDREPTAEEKNRILHTWRQRRGPGPGPGNAAAGPSGQLNRNMQPPGGQRPNPPPGQPQHPQRAGKRNSTSPPEEHGSLPGSSDNSTSPGSRKRARRATPSMEQQQPPQGMFTQGQPGQPPQAGPMGGLPQPPMQMRTPTMGNAPGPGMGLPPGMAGMPGPHMNGGFGAPMMPMNGMMTGGMSPGMGHPQPGAMMTPQMQQMQQSGYRPPIPTMHKPGMPGTAASPPASDQSFNPQGGASPFNNSRMPPGNKPMNMMPPPQSPRMNGPPKDAGTPAKDDPPQNHGMGRQTPNGGSTAPPTPGGPGQNSVPPTSNSAPPNLMSAASPSMMGAPTFGTDNLFPAELLSNVANSLEDFDPSMFKADAGDIMPGDINFERDFGQWFNNEPDQSLDGSHMDMSSLS
ncbi:hypothetical protein HGRIS_005193 [Hohenbuehelia grisea]|uniref:LisH domain-containing protein n=1 Tax=Hohenbuehelia grisea TaxID=104357 RepID=A0ABR3JEH6_9AGAR